MHGHKNNVEIPNQYPQVSRGMFHRGKGLTNPLAIFSINSQRRMLH